MKILTAVVTALALLGMGSAAVACGGMKNQTSAQTDKAPLLPPAGTQS